MLVPKPTIHTLCMRLNAHVCSKCFIFWRFGQQSSNEVQYEAIFQYINMKFFLKVGICKEYRADRLWFGHI